MKSGDIIAYRNMCHAEDSDTLQRGMNYRLHRTHSVLLMSTRKNAPYGDEGKCVRCGSTTDLHFDHIIPYSRGGTSLSAKNIQLLCMSCNLAKGDRIE